MVPITHHTTKKRSQSPSHHHALVRGCHPATLHLHLCLCLGLGLIHRPLHMGWSIRFELDARTKDCEEAALRVRIVLDQLQQAILQLFHAQTHVRRPDARTQRHRESSAPSNKRRERLLLSQQCVTFVARTGWSHKRPHSSARAWKNCVVLACDILPSASALRCHNSFRRVVPICW